MNKQVIIYISREYGSGGHEIAAEIAKDLDLKLYDRSMLDEIANSMNVKVELLEKFDEKPRNFMMTRRIGKHTNSMEEILADIQMDFIKKKADEGESFVIVGRCAETALKDYDGLISIFISGNKKCKRKRVMDKFKLNESEATAKMVRHDKLRKQYHNRHSDHKWGDSRHYNICINSSGLGIEGTAKLLEDYIVQVAEKNDKCKD